MSLALEHAWARHVPEIRAISKVYAEAAHGADAFEKARGAVRAFAESAGKPPRILVAKIGQDGHDRGQKVIASAFGDLGFAVTIGQLFATPEEVAASRPMSMWLAFPRSPPGTSRWCSELHGGAGPGMAADDIMIVVGGVVPPQDYDALFAAGAAAIYPPGTVISEAAEALLAKLNKRLGHGRKRRSDEQTRPDRAVHQVRAKSIRRMLQ